MHSTSRYEAILNKIILCVLLLLAGCKTAPIGNANISESLLQECPQLYKLEGMSGKALSENIDKNAGLYHACKDSKKALIDAVRTK